MIPPEVIATTCDCLKDILKVQLKLVDLAAGTTSWFRLVPLTPPHIRRGKKRPGRRGLRKGGDVRVTEVRAWVAVTLSDWGVAHGATFGRAHPHNIQVIDPAPVSALDAEHLAMLKVLNIVPRYLTLHVVYLVQCQTDLVFKLDT